MAASSLGAPQAAAPQHHFQVTRQSRPAPANEDAAGFVPTNEGEAGAANPCAASGSDMNFSCILIAFLGGTIKVRKSIIELDPFLFLERKLFSLDRFRIYFTAT